MHEYSIVEAMLGRIEEEVRAQNAAGVHRVEVRVGDLAGVERDLLAAAWEVFRQGTCCAEAPLVIHGSPARWACAACAAPLDGGGPLGCAACGGYGRLIEGGELLLERIELRV